MSSRIRTPLLLLALALAACSSDDDADRTDAGADTQGDTGVDAPPDADEDTAEPDADAPSDTDPDLPVDTGEDAADSDLPDLPEGPATDQCVGPIDAFLLVHGPGEPQLAAAACADDCEADADPEQCALDCTAAASGLTEGCSGCLVEILACVADACPTQCADPASEACGTCALEACGERRQACIGDLGRAPGPATVNFVNARADEGEVDGWFGPVPVPIVDAIAPGFGAVGAIPDNGGSSDPLEFRSAGASAADEPLGRATFEFGIGPESIHTFGLVGSAGDFVGVGIREDLSSPPDGVRVRFVNGAFEGAVHLFDLTSEPGVWFIQDLAFGAVTRDGGRAPGAFVLGVDTDRDESVDHVFDLGTMLADSQHTFWLTRSPEGLYVIDSTMDGELVRVTESVP